MGDLLVLAARLLKLETLPVTRVEGLLAVELDAMAVAYARLFELGEWDKAQLGSLALRFEVEIPAFEAQDLGFEITEIDLAIGVATVRPEEDEEIPALPAQPVSQIGDVWIMRRHRLMCGDSTDASACHRLMAGASARAVFADPPFGCPIDGFVSGKGRHREFVMGSGEMTPNELGTFFRGFIDLAVGHARPGALVYLVIDWRSLQILLDAAMPILGALINMAVWVKDRAGMGSFLRSRHKLVLILKVKGGRARNNVMLGRNGRDRSNVWSYPSAKTASKGSDEGNILANHPTPKPIALVADAILDCTSRGDIVLDPFLGSGTTLIAAEKVGRACYGVELDPL